MPAVEPALLQPALQDIQRRWGPSALQRLRALPPADARPAFSTGHPDLDALLGGGLPTGLPIELRGGPTTGCTSCALSTLAQAQQNGGWAAYCDPPRAFDPDYATQLGVNLGQLLLVQHADAADLAAIVHDLLACALFAVVVLDLSSGPTLSPTAMQRLRLRLRGMNTVLLLLTAGSTSNSPLTGAGVSVAFSRTGWVYQGMDISGYETRVQVLRHPYYPPGGQATLTIELDTLAGISTG